MTTGSDDSAGGARAALELLRSLEERRGGESCRGATEAELSALEVALGFATPEQLVSWLNSCNGTPHSAGGVFGWAPQRTSLDIVSHYRLFPGWRPKRWVPLAGDGAGNYYVIDAGHEYSAADAIFFVDTLEGPHRAAYVVGSNLWPFLYLYFAEDLGLVPGDWPFKRDLVLKADPDLERLPSSLLPWNVSSGT